MWPVERSDCYSRKQRVRRRVRSKAEQVLCLKIQEYETILEVTRPDSAPESVAVSRTPFLIGRGSDTGNHLVLEDPRISRRCAAIEEVDGDYLLKDRGHRPGIWVNGRRIAQ